jgi:hypothetical protein
MITLKELVALLAALLLAGILAATAGSAVPPPRLARQLPPAAAERAAARQRHSEALRAFFEAAGLPSGSNASNIVQRARAIDALTSAATNSAGKGRLGVALKDVRDRNPAVFRKQK